MTEADRRATVAANLPLTDSQGKAFWPVYLEYRAEVGGQNVRLAKGSTDSAGIRHDVGRRCEGTHADLPRHRSERLKLKEAYLKKFEKALPAMLVARAMQTEQKLDAMQAFTFARAIPLVPPVAQ